MARESDAGGATPGGEFESGEGGVARRLPASGAGKRSTPSCPDCRGSGKVALLISSVPCGRCGGTGTAPAAPTAAPAAPDLDGAASGGGASLADATHETTQIEYDADGRAVATVRWTYDCRDRLTRVDRTYFDPPAPTYYRYDDPGSDPSAGAAGGTEATPGPQ